jgi:hypothetical protein
VVLTLTPHIIRVLDLTADDLRPFRVSNDGNASPLIDLPIIAPQAPPVPVPPPAQPVPPPQLPPVQQIPGPIMPPATAPAPAPPQ